MLLRVDVQRVEGWMLGLGAGRLPITPLRYFKDGDLVQICGQWYLDFLGANSVGSTKAEVRNRHV